MNFRILAALPSRGRAAAGIISAVALMTSTSLSLAQVPSPPTPAAPKAAAPAAPKAAAPAAPKAAAPKAAPQGGQAAQQAPAGQPPEQQDIELIKSPWTKFCVKGQEANAKQICFTGSDGRIESGQPVVAAVLIEPEGETKKVLRITLPLGMQLQHGTRIIVDGNPPQQSPFVFCFQNGCVSDYEATPESVAAMKKGQVLAIQAIHMNGSPLTLKLPLADATTNFAKAYDGPPTDPKVMEENQKKLQEQLNKRAEDARKKLESTAPANPAAK